MLLRIALATLTMVSAGCAHHRMRQSMAAGCCCGYDNCRPAYTQPECVANARFQGWTYSWHEGACTSADRYPAPDLPARDH